MLNDVSREDSFAVVAEKRFKYLGITFTDKLVLLDTTGTHEHDDDEDLV